MMPSEVFMTTRELSAAMRALSDVEVYDLACSDNALIATMATQVAHARAVAYAREQERQHAA